MDLFLHKTCTSLLEGVYMTGLALKEYHLICLLKTIDPCPILLYGSTGKNTQ